MRINLRLVITITRFEVPGTHLTKVVEDAWALDAWGRSDDLKTLIILGSHFIDSAYQCEAQLVQQITEAIWDKNKRKYCKVIIDVANDQDDKTVTAYASTEQSFNRWKGRSKYIEYMYYCDVERLRPQFRKTSSPWRRGYCEIVRNAVGEITGIIHPPKTKRECQADAKACGLKAKFIEKEGERI